MTKQLPKLVLSSSRDIPFSQLVLSQKNVRRLKAGLSIEDLADDIYRRTLLQSLNVRPVVGEDGQETGMFEVPAGGRRFRALELLVKSKRMCVADPYIDTRDPEPKPEWLNLPAGKDVASYPHEEWLSGVGHALPNLRTTPDGAVVLAELTTIMSMEGRRAEEARLSVVTHPHLIMKREMPSFYRLGKERDYIGREYPHIFGREPKPCAVISGGPVFCEADFLALNPLLAAHLGWRYSSEGLFRWEDETGQLMAESRWWQQGNLSLNERSGMDEIASSGWLVLASPEGWRRMRMQLDGFVIQRLAGRCLGESDREQSPSVEFDTLPLPG